MKKLISLCLAVLLAVSLFSVALADGEPQYQSTRYFLSALNAAGYTYTYDVADSGEDRVVVDYTDGNFTARFVCLFDSTNRVTIYAWNVVGYSNEADAYAVCNQLNSNYLFAKFYADTTDKVIIAEMDFPLNSTADNSTEVMRGMNLMLLVIEEAYDTLLTLQ